MAKLPRTTQKIFAKNAAAGQVTTFGSIKDGSPVYSTSAGDIMNSNFEDGWSAAVEDDYAPYRQDRNGVDTAVTQQLAYLFQEGIPEYDSGTVYYKGSICKVTDGTGVKIYKSIYDNHSAAVTNTNRWHLILNVDSTNTIVSPSISSPTISGGSMSNGTFANPTFSGTVNVPLASASGSTDSTIAASIGWVNNANLSSNIVHKTGSETITGAKTFTSTIYQQLVNPTYVAKHTYLEKGTTPSTSGNFLVGLYDKNEAKLSAYYGEYNTSGYTRSSLLAYTPTSGASSYSYLSMITNTSECYARIVNASGITNKSLTNVTNSTTDDKIPCMGWVNNPACSTNVVHRSDNETIDGEKTFTNTCRFQGSGVTQWAIVKTDITKGTNPSEAKEARMMVFDSKGTSTYKNIVGGVDVAQTTGGTVATYLRAYKSEADSGSYESIAVYYPTSGSAYTSAPTPATSDDSTKIATTAYVKANLSSYALDSDVVKTSGDQTIAGVKTFSSTISGSIDGNAATVTNGVYTSENQNIGGTKTFTNNVYITKSGPVLYGKNTAITKGTAPASNNNTHFIQYQESGGKNLSTFMCNYNTSKNVSTRMYSYKANASDDSNNAYLEVRYSANGDNGIYWNGNNTDTNVSMTSTTESITSSIVPTLGLVNRRIAGDWGTVSSITSLTTSNSYTMPNSGFIAPKIQVKYHQKLEFLINGKVVVSFENIGGDASDNYEMQYAPIPVLKGDVLTFTSTATGTTVNEIKYWAYRS